MGIFIWTVLLFLNGICATMNYKYKSYRVAMFNALTTGISLVMVVHEIVEYYT
jgi:hypothetical protein